MTHKKLTQADQLYRAQRFDEAHKILTLLLKRGLTGADKVGALAMLGGIALFQQKYEEAAKYHKLYLNLRPDHYEALENLLFILHNLGKIHEMLPFYERALTLNPTDEMRINYGFCLCDNGRQEEGLAILEPFLQHKRAWSFYWHNKFLITPGKEMFALFAHPKTAPENASKIRLASSYLQRALTAWQAEDGRHFAEAVQEFLTYLDGLQGHKETSATQQEHEIQVKNQQNLQGYQAYLEKFVPLAKPLPVQENMPQLYVLGDSHVLPPHRKTVACLGHNWQLQARLVQGANWWMLASPKENEIGNAILHQIQLLPADATVLLSMGEIDCRHNGGMWLAHQKTGKSLTDLREETILPAVEKLAKAQGGRTFIACGMPTVDAQHRPGDMWKNMPSAEKEAYREHVKAANALWQEACLSHGWGFVDIQQGTQNPDGTAKPDLYIDTYHLKPDVLPQLLTTHLHPPKKEP